MRILVYEHVSGGGYAGQPINPSVLSEGFGMLRGFVADLKAIGHHTTVLLDERIWRTHPPLSADRIIPISKRKSIKVLKSTAKTCDATYIIAPETEKTLETLVHWSEQNGRLSLNSDANTINQVSDKFLLFKTLIRNGLPAPETHVFETTVKTTEIINRAKDELGYPLVVKPINGVSCSGLSLVRDDGQMAAAIAKVKSE